MKISRRFSFGVLVLAFVICGIDWSWADQTDDTSNELEPIIVSASRSDILSDHTADQTEVYTAENLQDLPAHNLAEALNYIPDVDIQNSGPLGQATSVSIRGSDSRQVLVMVDGIPFNTQLSGQANLSEIPLEDIQQIEVIKGGASSAWGSSLGGVINVITKPIGTTLIPQGSLTTDFGSFATTKNSLDLQGAVGNLGYSSFGSFLNADGNLDASHTEEIKNFTKLKYDFNQTTSLNASFGYSGGHLLYGPLPDSADIIVNNQPYVSRYGSVDLKVDNPDNQFSAAYKFNDQKTSFNAQDITTPLNSFSTSNQDFYQGLSLNDVYEFSNDQILTTGMDSDWHVIKSDTYLTKAEGINTEAPYANLDWRLEDWDFIPGARYDYNDRFGSQLSPSFGAVYHVPIWQDGLIRAKVYRAFNAPPLLWIYNNDPSLYVAPNPDLKAERATSYELGIEGPLIIHGLKVELNLYRSDVKDALSPVINDIDYVTQYQNINKVVRQGGEARLDYAMNKQWSIYTAVDFNDVINEETKTIVRDAGIARQSFKWGTSYLWPCGFKASLEGYYNRWSSDPGQANDRKPIFDVHLTQKFRNVFRNIDMEIFFNVYNIDNSKYWSSPTYPLPGRSVEGGVSFKF